MIDKLNKIYKNKMNDINELNTDSISYITHFLTNRFINNDKSIFLVFPNLYKAQKYYDIFSQILKDDILFYPYDEILTQLLAVGSNEFLLERLYTIYELLKNNKKIIITNDLAFRKIQLNPNDYIKASKTLEINKEYDLNNLKELFIKNGYKHNYIVEEAQQFSIRGEIIDFFSPLLPNPIRLDFFDNTLEQIKEFDIDTQLSISKLDKVNILPLTEVFYTDNILKDSLDKIKEFKSKYNLSEKEESKFENDILNLINRNKLETLNIYLGFINNNFNTISDFTNNYEVFVFDNEEININNNTRIIDIKSFIKDFEGDFFTKINFLKDINFIDSNYKKINQTFQNRNIDIEEFKYYNNNFSLLFEENDNIFKNFTTIITIKDREKLNYFEKELSKTGYKYEINPKNIKEKTINIFEDEFVLSFIDYKEKICIFNQDNIFSTKTKIKIKYRSVINQSVKISNIEDLKKGDYVVHYDFGIGIYDGLYTELDYGFPKDYIKILYANNDVLNVPIESINLILKYKTQEGTKVSLDSLNSKKWRKARDRVIEKTKELADKLIKLYALRKESKGIEFIKDIELETKFSNDFLYTETKDQEKAINEVLNDMEKPSPMDRIIIGDVGFGKTEIALRAAFKAVISGKQVCYVCPTTILSRQHYYSFKERMEKYGINVALLNRMKTKKEQTEILKNIKSGLIDIVIGTHRLFSNDISFSNLGLLIVDEEQRFGVVAKEKIKELKVNVDTIYLTATPIPRTLQMSLSGLKDYSIINTPPKNRYPVQTYVLEKNKFLLKEIIKREISRGGQVFYVLNNIEKLELVKKEIEELIPDIKAKITHARLDKTVIEQTIQEFIDHEFDLLIATSIIEIGIDIPNSNTLIVDNADRFGLSQLYQIRGRVGRTDKIAYAYFFYDNENRLTEEAKKRLKVIEKFTELGSGFKIAMQDLQIRGSGDILGKEQSGYIDSVGIDMYMKLLNEAITGNKFFIKKEHTEYNTKQTIDKNYVESDILRIQIHKQIDRITSINSLMELKDELIDKYGYINEDVLLYMYDKLLKKLQAKYKIDKIYHLVDSIVILIKLNNNDIINMIDILKFISFYNLDLKISNKDEFLKLELKKEKEKNWIIQITELLQKLDDLKNEVIK